MALACERKVVAFLHGQRIHVRAQRDHRPGLAAAQHGLDTGLAYSGLHLDARHLPQRGSDIGSGLFLLKREFRILVNVAAPLDDLRLDLVRHGVGIDLRECGLHDARDEHSKDDSA